MAIGQVFMFFKKAHKLALPDWLNQNYDRLLEIMDHGTASYKCPGMAKLTTGESLNINLEFLFV